MNHFFRVKPRTRAKAAASPPVHLLGMKHVPGGSFLMGSTDFYADEKPVRAVHVAEFWIQAAPVTNAEFSRFVAATGHVTSAEIAPDPDDYPGLAPEHAVAGSLVFTPPSTPVPLADETRWWSFVPGARWNAPVGPGSGVQDLEDHPVVHVTPADAEAFAKWAGADLPTEAEWEYAARGGLSGKAYAWGDELEPGGVAMAKIWSGAFPWRNDAPPGLERTSPVGAYPPNGYGLSDMIGNVWEWTATHYDAPATSAAGCCGGGRRPAEDSCDPRSRGQGIARRVAKGGSHLCAPDYCRRYRPAARWGQPIDTSTSHMGFRCVVRRRRA